MTIVEIQRQTERLTTGMSLRELRRLRDMIEEMIDARDADQILRRMESGKEEWVEWDGLKAKMEKKLA